MNIKIIVGVVFGGVTSFISAFLYMFIAQLLAGGLTSIWGESWLYIAVILPFSIVFGLLGNLLHKQNTLSKKEFWIISCAIALFISLFSGTVGAILGETIVRGGAETINVDATFIWGIIYPLILLPITIPFARFLIGIFYQIIRKLPASRV